MISSVCTQSHPRILDEFLGAGKLCDHVGVCSDFCVVPLHVDNSRTFELGGCDLLREGQSPIMEGTRPLVTDPVEFDLLELSERIRDDRMVFVIVGVIQVLKL